MNVIKMTSVEKMSKKNRKELYNMRRNGWNGLNPVTRVVCDKRKYNRATAKRQFIKEIKKVDNNS